MVTQEGSEDRHTGRERRRSPVPRRPSVLCRDDRVVAVGTGCPGIVMGVGEGWACVRFDHWIGGLEVRVGASRLVLEQDAEQKGVRVRRPLPQLPLQAPGVLIPGDRFVAIGTRRPGTVLGAPTMCGGSEKVFVEFDKMPCSADGKLNFPWDHKFSPFSPYPAVQMRVVTARLVREEAAPSVWPMSPPSPQPKPKQLFTMSCSFPVGGLRALELLELLLEFVYIQEETWVKRTELILADLQLFARELQSAGTTPADTANHFGSRQDRQAMYRLLRFTTGREALLSSQKMFHKMKSALRIFASLGLAPLPASGFDEHEHTSSTGFSGMDEALAAGATEVREALVVESLAPRWASRAARGGGIPSSLWFEHILPCLATFDLAAERGLVALPHPTPAPVP